MLALPRPLRSRLAAAFTAALCLTAITSSAAQAASGPTYYVDGASLNGTCSDSYTAAQAQSPATPWCSVSEAVGAVSPGAVIDVEPATYHEEVTLSVRDANVTLQGVGATRPIIDGDDTRSVGIQLINGVSGVTISGFEIENMTAPASVHAVGILGVSTSNDTIVGNVVHGISAAGLYSYGIAFGQNLQPGLVHNVTIEDNRIYDIGPGGESMGIWLLMTTDMTVQDNEIYLVRKEGIRDWCGLDNSFISNRMYLNWIGINLESAVGDYVANNDSYDNVWGYSTKHVANPTTLAMWGLSSPPWTQFVHNTSYDNTHADLALGMDAPVDNYVNVADNVFADPGDVHIHDFPSVRGQQVTLNGNVYEGSAPLYYTTWNVPHPSTYTTLAQMQSALGWEANGQVASTQFANAATGNLSTSQSTLMPGLSLGDGFGAQLGAVGVPAASNTWTRYPAQVIGSSTEQSARLSPAAASDGRDDTYWWSQSSTAPTGSVTFDLGSAEPINTFVLDVYAQYDTRNPQHIQVQVSSDNVNYTTVLDYTNPDGEGSSYKYSLPSTVTARYVRLNLLSSFGAPSIIFSDFGIGLLSPVMGAAASAATTTTSPAATPPSSGTSTSTTSAPPTTTSTTSAPPTTTSTTTAPATTTTTTPTTTKRATPTTTTVTKAPTTPKSTPTPVPTPAQTTSPVTGGGSTQPARQSTSSAAPTGRAAAYSPRVTRRRRHHRRRHVRRHRG